MMNLSYHYDQIKLWQNAFKRASKILFALEPHETYSNTYNRRSARSTNFSVRGIKQQ